MYYSINWDKDGYVVTLTQVWSDGMLKAKPLRKFKEQGDAMAFRDFDCPKLDQLRIKSLVRQYDPNVRYKRLRDGKRFVDYDKWAQDLYNEELLTAAQP